MQRRDRASPELLSSFLFFCISKVKTSEVQRLANWIVYNDEECYKQIKQDDAPANYLTSIIKLYTE